jgi:hypothetical protein
VLDLDSVVCDRMQVIANLLQDFGAWGQRVCITSFSVPFPRAHKVLVLFKFGFVVSSVDHDRKVTSQSYPPPTVDSQTAAPPHQHGSEAKGQGSSLPLIHVPARCDFREKYFQGFKLQEAIGRWAIMNAERRRRF